MLDRLRSDLQRLWRPEQGQQPEAPPSELDPEDPASWLSLDYIHDQVAAQLEAQSDL
jgi:hypothetical protein